MSQDSKNGQKRPGQPEHTGRTGEKKNYGAKPSRNVRRYEGGKPQGERRPYKGGKPQEGERKYNGPRSQEGERKYSGPRPQEGERKYTGPRFQEGERKYTGPRSQEGERKYTGPRSQEGERKYNGLRSQEGERKYNGPRSQEGERKSPAFHQDGEHREQGAPRFHEGASRWGARREVRPTRARTARDVALTAVGDVVRGQAFASQALDRALSGAELSPEDRRLAASLFYFTVENRLYIEWALGGLMEDKPEPVVLDILHLAAAQILFMDKIPDHAAVNEAVEQVRAAGRGGLDKLVNGVLRSLIRARDGGELILPDRETCPEEYLSIRYSLALPAVKRLVAAYGAETAEEILSYRPEERGVTVRPNRTRLNGEEFEAMLTREGFAWKHGAVEDAYLLTGAGSLAEHPGYRSGQFSIQGESSMLAALAVGARPGMQILDACAAPGGKTCMMAERMGGSGRVHAWDVYPHRVELIRAAAKRLGLENVRPAVHDARRAIESMELMMDAVLVDAPCSGLGVMLDKPDVKFRLTDEGLNSLIPLQREILEACAQMVKVGGRLVYSTCTILPEENREQVKAFLERHPEFELDLSEAWLPEGLKGRMEDGMLQLLPARDGVEGFFIARMARRRL